MTAWTRFWWSPASRAPLCLLRMAFGVVLTLKMLGLTGLHRFGEWTLALPYHYRGYMFLAGPDAIHLPIVPWLPALSEVAWLRCEQVALVAALLLALGVATRLAAAALLLFFAYPLLYSRFDYYHHIFHIVAVLPFFVFARCDEHWSVPAWRRPGPRPPRTILPLRMIQVWTTWIYVSASLGKTSGEWLGGSVLAAAVEDRHTDGPIAAAVLAVVPPAAIAPLIWALQAFIPVGLWIPRLRPYALAAGLLLHLGIDAMMHVESFSLQMLALYLVFLRTDERAGSPR